MYLTMLLILLLNTNIIFILIEDEHDSTYYIDFIISSITNDIPKFDVMNAKSYKIITSPVENNDGYWDTRIATQVVTNQYNFFYPFNTEIIQMIIEPTIEFQEFKFSEPVSVSTDDAYGIEYLNVIAVKNEIIEYIYSDGYVTNRLIVSIEVFNNYSEIIQLLTITVITIIVIRLTKYITDKNIDMSLLIGLLLTLIIYQTTVKTYQIFTLGDIILIFNLGLIIWFIIRTINPHGTAQ